MDTNGDRVVYTVDEVAKLLGLSRASAYQGIQTGEIPSIRIGRRILIPVRLLSAKLAEVGKSNAQTYLATV